MTRTKADLAAMVDAAEDCIRRWNASTNPVLHVAAGQLRRDMGNAEADAMQDRMERLADTLADTTTEEE